MKIKTLLEVIASAHLTSSLANVPKGFQAGGGLVLVAPPGHLKTTIIESALEPYPNCLIYSDINVRQLGVICEDIASKKYRTLALPDFEKVYKRDAETALNVEGHISAICEQGFSHASFEDKRMFKRQSRALVVCGIVETVYKRKFTNWVTEGFTRRFLWCHYILKDPNAISRAIHNLRPLDMSDFIVPGVPVQDIPFDVTEEESAFIWKMLAEHEGGDEAPFLLMKKIFAVIKWKSRRSKDPSKYAMGVLSDFSESLTKRGAELEI